MTKQNKAFLEGMLVLGYDTVYKHNGAICMRGGERQLITKHYNLDDCLLVENKEYLIKELLSKEDK